MSKPIYLDYAATTPVDPIVVKAMQECLEEDFGNPASRSHAYGWKAESLVEDAREAVADLIGAQSSEIIWTSGATESDNLAIKGAAHFYQSKGKHIITSQIEHKAVLDSCRQLEREGFEVTYLAPNKLGRIEVADFIKAIRPDTILASIMHVNNEMGTIQDIKAIGKITREKGIVLHVDAAQSFGKMPINVDDLNIDMLSISAHKIYGPKGIGALYVRKKPRIRLEAMMHGGGHERGMRSGTLPTHQIVGLAVACQIAKEKLASNAETLRIKGFHDKMWNAFKDMEECYLNGDEDNRLHFILNVSFNYIEGESLMMAIKNLAVSSGSACTSASLEPSYVLRAIGRSDELAHSSLRFSFGRFTTEEQVDEAIKSVKDAVLKLRELSPLWEMFKDGIDLAKVEWVGGH